MKRSFEEAKLQKAKEFKRDTGLCLDNFELIIDLVEQYIAEEHQKTPNKKKGLSPSLSVSDRVLLCIYYLRHYPTFKNLGDNFGISESYANKIYHYILTILVNVLRLDGSQTLVDSDLDILVIDVTEQEIERPVKRQRRHYSGKKKT